MNTDKELSDAMEMLGKGYEHPAIEIEKERTVVTRRGGKLTEETRPAFVKISTSFKAELKDIDEVALKVWLYIALSVNRHSNKANPGYRKIHEDTGLAVNTIRAAVERLENKYHLLTVETGSGKASNFYEPVDYVSANRSVSADDTHNASVSVESRSVSVESRSVSASRQKNAQPDLTRVNQIEEIKKSANKTVDAILEAARQSAGKSWTKLPEPYHALARAFCEATTLDYSKKQCGDWLSTFSDWMMAGYTPEMITEAVKAICAQPNPPAISRPGSIDWKLRDLKVKKANLAPVQQEEKVAPIPPSWQKYYDNVQPS